MQPGEPCHECGREIPADAPGGLCPVCLLRGALKTRSDEGETSEVTDAPDPAAGSGLRFGPYTTLRILGEGGMGIVYLAQQKAPIQRTVALKVIKPGFESQQVVARFESERQALAMMDHPGIARVFDAGETPDHRPYFAMEYVPGIPITEYCDARRLNNRQRLELFGEVCQAIHNAHRKGIIHRDIKPSNVLVSNQDGIASPKVIDFGIAKATSFHLTERTLYTEQGLLMGTPEYMSPEQAGPNPHDVDTATDIYSLGVLLYELLVGALPFEMRELRQAGYLAMLRVIREDEPPTLVRRLEALGAGVTQIAERRQTDAHSLAREVRGDLEWITLRALEKERHRRYGSVSELAADVVRHLNDEPVLAGPPGRGYRLRKFVRKHRFGVGAAAAILLCLVAGLTASTILYFREQRQRTAAEWQLYKSQLSVARASIDKFRSKEARDLLIGVPKPLRNWEWRWLYWLADTTVATLQSGEPCRGDNSWNTRVAFSADGSRLFVSTETSVHAWEMGSFPRIGDYGPFGSILAMTSDGTRVACRARGRGPEVLEIGEISTGRQRVLLEGSASPFAGAGFSSDGSRLATLSLENEIRIWDTRNGRNLLVIRGSPLTWARGDGAYREQIALSLDGRRVASTENNRIIVRDAVTGREIFAVKAHLGPAQFLGFSQDGKRVISVCESVRTWDAATGRNLATWGSSPGGVFHRAAESPDGSYVATMGWHGGLQIRDRPSGEILAGLYGMGIYGSAAMTYSPDSKYLICLDNRGVVRVFDGHTLGGQFLRRVRADPGATTFSAFGLPRSNADFMDMSLSRGGRRLAVASGADLEVMDAWSGASVAYWKHAHEKRIRAVAYHPWKQEIASGSEDTTIRTWAPNVPLPLLALKGHTSAVTALAYSPDGRQLVSGSLDGTVIFWDAGTGASLLTRRFDWEITQLAFSKDGRTLLVAVFWSVDPPPAQADLTYITRRRPGPFVELLDAASGNVRAALDSTLVRGMHNAAFNPGGEWVASGDNGAQGAAIWDARSGKHLRRLAVSGRSGNGSYSFVFTPDGRRLVGSYPEAISIWNPETGDLILQSPEQNIRNLQFSPDGARLYARRYDAILVFDTRPAVPAEAEELLRSLTQRFPLYCDLREFLQNDRGIEPSLRDTVLRMIEGRGESAAAFAALIEDVLVSPASGVAAYERVLHRCHLIVEQRPWFMAALGRVGMGQYRLGRYAEALPTLERATALLGEPDATQLLFLTMARCRLGQASKARESLDRARVLLKDANPVRMQKQLALLAEAEALLAGKR